MKHTFKKIALTTFGLVVLLGATYVFAGGVWNSPSAAAPGANIPIPIHEGTDQIKDAGLAVTSFLASQDALFKQEVFFRGTLRAVSLTNSVETIPIGSDVTATGDITTTKNIKSTTLVNTTGTETLCADANGKIILCAKPPVVLKPTITAINIALDQSGTKSCTAVWDATGVATSNRQDYTALIRADVVEQADCQGGPGIGNPGNNCSDLVRYTCSAASQGINFSTNPPRADGSGIPTVVTTLANDVPSGTLEDICLIDPQGLTGPEYDYYISQGVPICQ